jgi:hypothetical protein
VENRMLTCSRGTEVDEGQPETQSSWFLDGRWDIECILSVIIPLHRIRRMDGRTMRTLSNNDHLPITTHWNIVVVQRATPVLIPHLIRCFFVTVIAILLALKSARRFFLLYLPSNFWVNQCLTQSTLSSLSLNRHQISAHLYLRCVSGRSNLHLLYMPCLMWTTLATSALLPLHNTETEPRQSFLVTTDL